MNLKTVIIIKILCLIALLSLSTAVYLHGKDLSCNKCIVNFESYRNQGSILDYPKNISISLVELYNQLKKDNCVIQWDETNGYYFA